MIISIDHGYGMVKIPTFLFKTGITEYENEPYTTKNVVKFKGKYYVCGSGRQSLVRDKTKDDSYYILTLMAIMAVFCFTAVPPLQMMQRIG